MTGARRTSLLLRCSALAALAIVSIPVGIVCDVPAFAVSGRGGGLFGAGQRLSASGLARSAAEGGGGAKAVIPVVDDSELDDLPASKDTESGSKSISKASKKVAALDSLLETAEGLASSTDRTKRRTKLSLTLEEGLKGVTLENEEDLSITMAEMARTGKVDTSLEVRLTKWLGESQELLTNPNKVQITYGIIFIATVMFIWLLGLFTWSANGVHFRGGEDMMDRRRQAILQDPYVQFQLRANEIKKRSKDVEYIRDLDPRLFDLGDVNYQEPEIENRGPIKPSKYGVDVGGSSKAPQNNFVK